MLKNKTSKVVGVFLIVLCASTLNLLSGWEMTQESWGYWYFAKKLNEDLSFVIPDRSPLYTVYLKIYDWIEYPFSVDIEFIVTTSFVIFGLYIYLKRYLGLSLSLLISCTWIPFIQISEPPVQKIALLFGIVALLIRLKYQKIYLFYFFLILAYFFRSTYILLIIIFIIYDLYLFRNQKITFGKKYLLFLVPIFFYILSAYFQSSDNWNNGWFADTIWFPSDGKSLATGGSVQGRNWVYILHEYGNFEGHDFYFTNQEIFKGGTGFYESFIANKEMFIKVLLINAENFFPELLSGVWMPKQINKEISWFLYTVLLTLSILFCYKKLRTVDEKIFMIGSLLIVTTSILVLPKSRYLIPIIPFYIIGIYELGCKILRIKNIKCL